jgi:hypothetical protein
MTRAFGLALRLAFTGDRGARARLLLMTLGMTLGTVLLLGVTGALPAYEAQQGVLASRTVTFDGDDARAQGVRVTPADSFWRGRELHLLLVEQVGPPVVPPAGLVRVPGEGEVLVSPALAAALDGPRGTELTPRLDGTVVGGVGPAGLTGPEELYAVIGVPPGRLAPAGYGAGFNTSADNVFTGATDTLQIAVALAAVGLLVPLLVFVAVATRLSAATRDRRAAAMRLVGATARQVRAISAVEGATVGVLGVAAGALLFRLVRGPAVALVPAPDGIDPDRVWPSATVLVLTLLGVPLLAAVTGPLSLRRVVTTPLGVSRRLVVAKAGPLRLLPLGIGLAMLVGAFLARSAVLDGKAYGAVLLLGGAGLSLIGLAVAGAALSRVAGQALARWGRGPASLLAGRRLVLDPGTAARSVVGTTLVVAVGGWLLAFLPLLAEAQGGSGADEAERTLDPGTVVAPLYDVPASTDLSGLSVLDGVTSVADVRLVTLVREGQRLPGVPSPVGEPDVPPVTGVVGDCAQISATLRAPLEGCVPGRPALLDPGYPTEPLPPRLRVVDDERLAEEVLLGRDLPTIPLPQGLRYGLDGLNLQGEVLLPPGSVPASATSGRVLLIATDGAADTVERVRSSLAGLPSFVPPLTAGEGVARGRAPVAAYERAALLAIVLVVLVGGLSLAVTTVDGLRERRRAHAALVALGTSVHVLRRGVLLQTALPLLLNVSLGVAVSAFASALYLRLGAIEDEVLPLPWAGYGAIAAAAVAASLLATAAALPFVRAATRPDALRTE